MLRLKVLLTRLTLGVLQAFIREWLASIATSVECRLFVDVYEGDVAVEDSKDQLVLPIGNVT